jgi:RNA-directed DNA polymerase
VRRTGDLFEELVCSENLRLAFWKAQKAKSDKSDCVAFRKDLDAELMHLHEDILAGSVNLGEYNTFTICDPKRRLICAPSFRERVLHHALMNVCDQCLENYQMSCSYACRRGKGLYGALNSAWKNAKTNRWYAKLDVRKYFESVDHGILKELLSRRFKDRRLLDLLGRIIDSFESRPGRGIPIGALTSQYFANHYLAVLDHFVKETLRVGPYVRYMDDFVLWGQDRKALQEHVRTMDTFIHEKLRLELKVPILDDTSSGMTFLGYRVFPYRLRLSARSRRRFRKKLRTIESGVKNGQITEFAAAAHALPLLAFVRHGATRGLRAVVLQGVRAGARPGLEPREPRGQLEQHAQELSLREPEQEQARQLEQQPGLPPGHSSAPSGCRC